MNLTDPDELLRATRGPAGGIAPKRHGRRDRAEQRRAQKIDTVGGVGSSACNSVRQQ
jgi:hypothetical protein